MRARSWMNAGIQFDPFFGAEGFFVAFILAGAGR
jgi:hypothetical protein